MAGVKSVLGDEESVDLFIDYMDAKRCSDPEYMAKFSDLLAHKYRFHQFDAILSTDDPALDFLLEYRGTLFPDVPVVFCGINDFRPDRLQGQSLITGVYETSDIEGTIRLMLRLHPETSEIAIVLDNTISGNYFQTRIQRAESALAGVVKFRYLTGLDLPELGQELRSLPASSLALWAVYLRTPEGVSLSSRESVRFTAENSRRPVYCIWDVVGQGVVGGKVTSPRFQGEVAAQHTLRVLRGADPDSIEVSGSPTIHIFDFDVMNRFGIQANRLPANATVLNRPFSFYQEYRTLIWVTIGFGIVLVSIILALIYYIGKRTAAEDALIESEERFREMSARTGQMIYDYNLNTGDIKWDGAITELTGYTHHEFRSIDVERWAEMIHEDDRERVVETLNSAMETGTAQKVEYRLIRKDKTVVMVEDDGTFVAGEDGNYVRMLGNMKDISKRKEIEERLRHVEKMSAIGQLAGGIAHDFNNQLTGVLGFAELLKLELEDEELSSYAQGIENAASRSSDLTAQLLAFSRRGKTLVLAVDLHRIISEVVSILGHSIDKRIKLEQDLWSASVSVQGDPTQLQNAILNIALNARDAMPDGGVLLLKTRIVTLDEKFRPATDFEIKPGQFAEVTIKDSGHGMDHDTQNRIFEPFFTTKEVGQGTGMGLASVYGTVKRHGGTIAVNSHVDQGTSIVVYLPLGDKVHAETGTAAAETPDPNRAHILLVDDEPVVRAMAEKMLASLGYSVVSCKDGHEAMIHFRENWSTIDVVILDMVMPVMGGKETFLAMKKIHPEVRVILSSGYSVDGEAQEIIEQGVLAFVGKPYSRAGLAEALKQVILKK